MKKRPSSLIKLVCLIFSLALFACHNSVDPVEKIKFNVSDFDIQILGYFDLAYTGVSIAPVKITYVIDKDSIILTENYQDGKFYYQAINFSQIMGHYIDSYMQTGKQLYLIRAERLATKLEEMNTEYQGAIFYLMSYDFALHDNWNEVMKMPWYSGIVQGRLLSVISRLYTITGNEKYLQTADKIFKSFDITTNFSAPWVAYVDDDGYYWIEEYPWVPATHVLNGFIVAIIGIYDYYLIKRDDASLLALNATLTTLKHYLNQYRVVNGLSYYCLGHKVQDLGYHKMHSVLLDWVVKFSGDDYLKAMSDSLRQDCQ